MTVRQFNLVVPLAPQKNAAATVMRATDTAGQMDLFGASGAVSPLIGACAGLRQGDVDSTNGHSIATGTITPGRRTSTTATRTTTTRTTSFPSVSSADQTAERHAEFSFEALVRAYIDCRKNKRSKHSARAFEVDQEAGLFQLYSDLTDGSYCPGRSICFVITRPKAREVWAAEFRDRIVHHLLYNHIAPRFERAFIADSCACIKGRGTLYAAERLETKVRSITQNWQRPTYYLKCDLANFFVSIDKHILRDLLAARITEPWWMRLTELVLFHDPRNNAQIHSPPARMALVPTHKSLLNQAAHFGLPIGNLSSQFFANVYLNALDQFVKHQLRCRHYIRYVDDFILLHESPKQLTAWHNAIEEFLPRELNVRLNPAKTIRQPVARGIDFVGQVIKPWRRILRRRTFREALSRIYTIDAADVFTTANSYFGLARQATHSHTDRTRIANLVRKRGLAVDYRLTKSYRGAGT